MTKPLKNRINNPKWVSYKEASDWAQSQNIMTTAQWLGRCAQGLPKGIPAAPDVAYGTNFVGWEKFLGVQRSRDGRTVFWNYERVRDWARGAGIKSSTEWETRRKEGLPSGVPAQPFKVYKESFGSWGEFLGTGVVAPKEKKFVPYAEVVAWTKSQGVKTQKEWKARHKALQPKGIPSNPDRIYEEHISWGELLGTGRVATQNSEFVTYQQASEWARSEGVVGRKQWDERCKTGLPPGIPRSPPDVYKGEFKGWGVFFGRTPFSNKIVNKGKSFIPYSDVVKWVRDMGVTSKTEWYALCKKGLPPGIPASPDTVYPNDFKGWDDFLDVKKIFGVSKVERVLKYILEDVFEGGGTSIRTKSVQDKKGKKYRVDVVLSSIGLIVEYDGYYWHMDKHDADARKTCALMQCGWKVVRVRGRPLSLVNKDWDVSINENLTVAMQASCVLDHLCKLNDSGLINLSENHKEKIREWNGKIEKVSFRDILNKYDEFRSYEEARNWARKEKITSQKQWKARVAECLPEGIPSSPNEVYREKFNSWGEFLGTDYICTKKREFAEYAVASAWVKQQGVSSSAQWWERCKLGIPKNIPTNPCMVYGQEFKDNGGWFGYLGKEVSPKKSRKS